MQSSKIIREILNLGFIALVVLLSSCGTQSKEGAKQLEEEVKFDESLAIPIFNIATIPDSTTFNSSSLPKKGIVMVKYFSPDCNHCQDEAELFHSKKDSLQNFQTVWVSGEWANLEEIEEFAKKYNLKDLNPVAIGKETSNKLISFYKFKGIPLTAIYKDNQLLTEYREVRLPFKELIAINDGVFVPSEVSDAEDQKKNASEQ